MATSARHYDQDKESTLYIGNLDERCTDSLVWELMLQAGPIINVHLPKDRVTQTHQGYGFVEFGSEDDADYATKIMNQIRLWGKPIRVNKASADKRGINGAEGGIGGGQGVGAELFVGNLDPMVDERVLFDTFSRFGPLLAPPKIARDEATNLAKGYGFISYATFEASDDAIQNMHGQYLMNKEVTVQYAYKKDGKGERHGDEAERSLAKSAKAHGVQVEIPAMPAALVMPNGPPGAAAGMGMAAYPPPQGMGMPGMMGGMPAGMGGYPNGGPVHTPQQPPPSYQFPQAPPAGGFGYAPQQQQQQYQPQHQQQPPMQPWPGAPPPGPNGNGPANPQSFNGRSYQQNPLQPPPPAAGLPQRPGGPLPSFVPGGPPGFAGGPPQGFAPPPGFRPPPQGPPGGYQR
ncbi:Spliceosome-associated protein 49 [Elasticomyces elasticus]|nr:Spliceosome-associated protein 49 [Elasticomyces elasticus]